MNRENYCGWLKLVRTANNIQIGILLTAARTEDPFLSVPQ